MHNRPRLISFRVSCLFQISLLCLGIFQGVRAAAQDPAIPAGDIRIHYHRPDGNYTGWTVYAFDNTTEDTGQLWRRSSTGDRDRQLWCVLRCGDYFGRAGGWA